jgi:membrane protein YdbS with pleckstrin-like domain
MQTEPDKPWFAAKRYGLGAGLPIAWQGWLLLAVYALIVIGAMTGLPFVLPAAVSAMAITAVAVVASVVLLVICMRKTRGGWRWRWGGKD